jgi:urease accessory protein
MRGSRPFIFSNLKENRGVAEIVSFIVEVGGVAARHAPALTAGD